MAAYPSVVQAYGSSIASDDGTVVERAVSGKPRFRSYYTDVQEEIRVVHDLDDTDKQSIETHYAGDRFNAFLFTYAADDTQYTVRYARPPQYKPIRGGRWQVFYIHRDPFRFKDRLPHIDSHQILSFLRFHNSS